LNWTGALDIDLGEPFARLCENESLYAEEPKGIFSLFLTRDYLDVNAKSSLGDWEPWYSLAIDYEIDSLQELVAHPTFDPWRTGRPSRHHYHYFNDLKHRVYFTSQELCNLPAITQLLDNDRRFDFNDFYALELLWPFVHYAFTDLEPTSYRQIDWMGIEDNDQHIWKYQLRDALEFCHISFETIDSKGRSFLHYLATVGENEDRQDHLKLLLQRLPTELKDGQGRTALHVAAENGHEHTVRNLLNSGADPLVIDEEGMSVVHCATTNNNVALVQLLVDTGANVKAKTKYGESLLHTAVCTSDSTWEMIHLLIGLGVPIADEDSFGRTPLHIACDSNIELFTALLELGADPASWNCKHGTRGGPHGGLTTKSTIIGATSFCSFAYQSTNFGLFR
jgi:hypothetical protein